MVTHSAIIQLSQKFNSECSFLTQKAHGLTSQNSQEHGNPGKGRLQRFLGKACQQVHPVTYHQHCRPSGLPCVSQHGPWTLLTSLGYRQQSLGSNFPKQLKQPVGYQKEKWEEMHYFFSAFKNGTLNEKQNGHSLVALWLAYLISKSPSIIFDIRTWIPKAPHVATPKNKNPIQRTSKQLLIDA